MFETLRKWMAVRPTPSDDPIEAEATGTEGVFITDASLTFPGLAVVGSEPMYVIGGLLNVALPNLALASAVAAVLGLALIILELTDGHQRTSNKIGRVIFIGILNTVILAAALMGVSATIST